MNLFFHPELRRPTPQPLQVDLRKVLLFGIAIWLLSGLTILILEVTTEFSTSKGLPTCITGVLLGGLGLSWEHHNRRRYRALAETIEVETIP